MYLLCAQLHLDIKQPMLSPYIKMKKLTFEWMNHLLILVEQGLNSHLFNSKIQIFQFINVEIYQVDVVWSKQCRMYVKICQRVLDEHQIPPKSCIPQVCFPTAFPLYTIYHDFILLMAYGVAYSVRNIEYIRTP